MRRVPFCSMNALAALAVLWAMPVAARTFDVTVWRGETLAVRVPDFCELGDTPPGLSIRRGTLRSVKFAPTPDSLKRVETCDRVSWDGWVGSLGPRVLEVAAPADAKPGVYTCGMMRVKVLDRELPPAKAWRYYLDIWQHPWAVARVAGVEPFSKAHYEAMRPVYELLATAGQKTITVPIIDLPWDHQCRDAYHSLVADGDFRLFDEYVQFCLDCGLGPDISCYSLCPWTLGKTIDEEQLEKTWGPFLDKFAAHLKEKGWFEKTLMAMDERSPKDVAKVARFVQKHAPGMRISMAGNRKPSDFQGIAIDVYSQILLANCVTPEFLAEAAERRARGLVTTHYVCCDPAAPNTFLTSEPDESFWCGASPAFLGLDGFLRWAWNSWPENPVLDGSYGAWQAGDTFLCYPKGEPSWRFLELRNGIIAAEKVRLLKERGLFADEIAKVAALYDVGKANAKTCDFKAVRAKTLALVNRE